MSGSKTAMITGVNGQDGSYLSELLISKGYRVIGLKRRTSSFSTERIDHLLMNAASKTQFILHYYDLNDGVVIRELLRKYQPDEFYNLAAQSHVAVSFQLPEYTSECIAGGTLRILEAIKTESPRTRFYQASSSEMFGDSKDRDENGYTEKSILKPVSPYAVAKTHAHHMVALYRDAYGMHASSGILFNHESPRRGETFVTRKITMAAARIAEGLQKTLRLGNLDAKRDWGFAGDYVEGMWLMLQQEKPDDYVIATGQTHTVREFLSEVFEYSGLGDWKEFVNIDPTLLRPNEVPFLLGDSSKARRVLGWQPKVGMRELAHMMYDSDLIAAKKESANAR
jgi:GDPmannose 4,6-dehydratase